MGSRGIVTIGVTSFALAVLSAATSARATTVMVDFLGPEGDNSGGVYTYPYFFNIDSSAEVFSLMCDDDQHQISDGQTWTANTLNMSDINATNVEDLQFPDVGVTGYLEAGYLFQEEASAYQDDNSDPDGLYNWAVWDLMSQSDASASVLSSGQETQVQDYLGAAESAGSSLTPSEFSDVTIYTPTDMESGGPQEFLGYGTPAFLVPEPCTAALMVLGSATLLVRRNRRPA